MNPYKEHRHEPYQSSSAWNRITSLLAGTAHQPSSRLGGQEAHHPACTGRPGQKHACCGLCAVTRLSVRPGTIWIRKTTTLVSFLPALPRLSREPILIEFPGYPLIHAHKLKGQQSAAQYGRMDQPGTRQSSETKPDRLR